MKYFLTTIVVLLWLCVLVVMGAGLSIMLLMGYVIYTSPDFIDHLWLFLFLIAFGLFCGGSIWECSREMKDILKRIWRGHEYP